MRDRLITGGERAMGRLFASFLTCGDAHPVVRVLMGLALIALGVALFLLGIVHGPGLVLVGALIIVGAFSGIVERRRPRLPGRRT